MFLNLSPRRAGTGLAAVAYQQGDGAVAGSPFERALASDPGSSLARLLMQGLARGVEPELLRRAMTPGARRGVTRRRGRRRGAG